MAQFLRPATDITTTSWTRSSGTNSYFTYIGESVASDTDYVDITGVINAGLEVGIKVSGNVAAPRTRTASNHIVRIRAWAVGGGGAGEQHTILLLEGATTIATVASGNLSRTAGTAITYTLTLAQANSISDYSNLRLRFTATTLGASETYRVSWAEMEIPDGFPSRRIIIS